MTVIFDPEKIAVVNRYLNNIHKGALRRYGFDYVAWLRGGGIGHIPSHSGVSHKAAEELRAIINSFNLFEGAERA